MKPPGASNDSLVSGHARRNAIALVGLATTQIIGWGSTFYLPAVLGEQISLDLSASSEIVFSGISVMMLACALLSPRTGPLIAQYGARRILTAGSALMAVGLLLMSSAQGMFSYLLSWTIVGLASPMALNLAAYSAVAQIYGHNSARAMTVLSFFTGLASAIFWPTTGWLSTWLDWHAICRIYALVHLAIALPIHHFALDTAALDGPGPPGTDAPPSAARPESSWAIVSSPGFYLIALALAMNCFIVTGLQVHIIELLKGIGLSAATSIKVCTLIGPSQVLSRGVWFSLKKMPSALGTGLWAAALFPTALLLIWLSNGSLAVIVPAVVLLGVAMGLSLPVRATIPLELFGEKRFAVYFGYLSLFQNIASAAAPLLLASLIASMQPSTTIVYVTAFALAALAAMARLRHRYRPSAATAPQARDQA